MLKKIILINSANFSFLDIDLSRDLFFLGDNGSGKTTVIRAIHYLFNGDIQNLGIPRDKESFKEYYFKYENSYIIYVLHDFFIFMYKRGGEIVKLFSKQKFDISKIIDDNSNIYDFSDIRKYIRLANLKVTIRGVDEYRRIIYGQDNNYLDFQLTSIKNYNTFIGLFNQVFNIDKSIIDSKSIKKAIQQTLDYKTNLIDFNYEYFLNEINQFQSDYKFFRDFEKRKESIDKAQLLRDNLLELETDIKRTKKRILYRVEKERELFEELKVELQANSKYIDRLKKWRYKRAKRLKKCKESLYKSIDNLKLDIKEIERLRDKFTKSRILENKNLADRYEELKEEFNRLNREKYILEKSLTTQIDTINREIEELIYKRDKRLVREREDREDNEIRELNRDLKESIEKLRLDFERYKESRELELNDINRELDEIEKRDIKLKEEFLKDRDKYHKKLERLKSEKNSRVDEQNRYISEIKSSILDINRDIKEISINIEDKNRDYKREKDNRDREYYEARDDLDREILKYKNMIFSKRGSFKEFLNQEVDGWEYELYPILDDTLLDREVDELKPKLLDNQNLFGIEIITTHLKKILTPIEAEEKIRDINRDIKNLEESYNSSLFKLKEEYDSSILKLVNKREILLKEIKEKEKLIEEISSSNKIEKWFKSAKDELDRDFNLVEERYKKDKEDLESIKLNRVNIKNNIILDIKHKDRYLKREIDRLNRENIEKIKNIRDKFNSWLREKQHKINMEIAKKEASKESITKDEILDNLKKEIIKVENRKDRARDAKKFLEEYDLVKEKIGSLHLKKSELKRMENRIELFSKRVENRIEIYKEKIEDIQNRNRDIDFQISKLKKGENRFLNLKEDFSNCAKEETDIYLYKLIEDLNRLKGDNIDKKINLKRELDRLNSLKYTHYLNINFEFDEYDRVEYISNLPMILNKLDEIIEFRKKQIDFIKKSSHSNFKNFTEKLPSKINIFNDIETNFLKQIKRVKSNLSMVDFGVISNISIDTKIGDKKSIARYLKELRVEIDRLSGLLHEQSLWYDQKEVIKELDILEKKFKSIKNELKGDAISIIDTIDLSLSFDENGKRKRGLSQIKNESSTGGSILLKIAIAISILELFIKESNRAFFLIVDEVSRLHSNNQEKLREFANSKGFGIIFVTPEPTYSKPKWIKYYRFEKSSDGEFEVIELNR